MNAESQQHPATHKTDITTLSIADINAIAEEAFIYGIPIVMNYAVMNEFVIDENSGQYKAPFNNLASDARVFTYEDTAVVTPNSDTPYSMVWFDLRSEPMVISVPAIDKERYYSIQLVDGNAYNYGYIGSRCGDTEAGDYLIVSPDWQGDVPSHIKQVFRSSTPFGLTVFRTQLFDADDMPNVEAIQAEYQVRPLSSFLNQAPPPSVPSIDFFPASNAGIKQNFYQYLDAALAFVPVTAESRDIRDQLAMVGIGTDQSFDFESLPPLQKTAFLSGMKKGGDKVSDYAATNMSTINGWNIGALFGDSEFFNGDWLKRAAGAMGGIYGNDAAEAVYPMTRTNAEGEALDGSKYNYTLTFSAGQLPPVNSFWSVTMYDDNTQLLIQNPIDRYLINSPMLPDMTTNADGSLTIYLQKDSPGTDKESNWLPAPNGPIYLVMRLYWPTTEDPSILPAGEGSWNPPAIVQAD